MGKTVELTQGEMQTAALTGVTRATSDAELLWKNWPSMGWGSFIEQAGAELAVGKLTGRWVDFDRRHVGPWAVRYGNEVFENDDDLDVIIFVSGEAPSYEVQGWLYAHEAKRKENWDNARWVHAFLIPWDELHPLETLPSGRSSSRLPAGVKATCQDDGIPEFTR